MIVRWRDRLARRALQEISLFLAPSAWLPAEMARRGLELAPTEVVANGQESDVAVMHRHDTQLPVRFGYIGGVSQKKGLSVLAEAFQGDLGRQLIIRGFPTEAELAAFRTAHPALHARLECFDSDRESFYRDVDVVVVPSLWLENQPMVVLEAFARGKPVIASRIGGLPQMFSDGEGGRFFAAGDAQSLRRVAAELAGDTAIVRRLAATIPRWPSWHESTAQILGHLERLVRARKSRPAAS
jgi:glycosyltransferase involved in cell wall biosynthesis